MPDPPVAVPGPASESPAEPPASLNEAVAEEAWIGAAARKATEHLSADPVVSPTDTRRSEIEAFVAGPRGHIYGGRVPAVIPLYGGPVEDWTEYAWAEFALALLAVGERDRAEIERLTEKRSMALALVRAAEAHVAELEAEQERDRQQIARLTEAVKRAVDEAQHLFEMIPPQAWRDHYGVDDGQGHHEGDYRAEQTRAELDSLRAVLAGEEDADNG